MLRQQRGGGRLDLRNYRVRRDGDRARNELRGLGRALGGVASPTADLIAHSAKLILESAQQLLGQRQGAGAAFGRRQKRGRRRLHLREHRIRGDRDRARHKLGPPISVAGTLRSPANVATRRTKLVLDGQRDLVR